ncbi:hypothetical protein M885DRAFT_548652 [Pelagophyceae sp. CCMP2097]|nr:hypothetical protein M885DRAFT_548652 [Pelagophyceae sp. CCMP2097]
MGGCTSSAVPPEGNEARKPINAKAPGAKAPAPRAAEPQPQPSAPPAPTQPLPQPAAQRAPKPPPQPAAPPAPSPTPPAAAREAPVPAPQPAAPAAAPKPQPQPAAAPVSTPAPAPQPAAAREPLQPAAALEAAAPQPHPAASPNLLTPAPQPAAQHALVTPEVYASTRKETSPDTADPLPATPPLRLELKSSASKINQLEQANDDVAAANGLALLKALMASSVQAGTSASPSSPSQAAAPSPFIGGMQLDGGPRKFSKAVQKAPEPDIDLDDEARAAFDTALRGAGDFDGGAELTADAAAAFLRTKPDTFNSVVAWLSSTPVIVGDDGDDGPLSDDPPSPARKSARAP